MLVIIKFILFISIIFSYGFIALSQLTRIKSLILLISFSATFGIAQEEQAFVIDQVKNYLTSKRPLQIQGRY